MTGAAPIDGRFSVTIDQNPYLPGGTGAVEAVITVGYTDLAPAGTATPEQAPDRVELLLIDRSASMGIPTSDKLVAAKLATIAALDLIPDGVAFAVVAGSHESQMVYPRRRATARADQATRDEARRAITTIWAQGGTAIGNWLLTAKRLMKDHPNALGHAILLTDGRNEHETQPELAAAIAACAGVFTCDCRGVGTDWDVAELRGIASGLLGTVDIVADPRGLADGFRSMMATSLQRSIPALALRLWTPIGAIVNFVKQVAPAVEDLTGRREDIDAQQGEYPLGSWRSEERDYHIGITVKPGAIGREKLAGRVTVAAGGLPLGEGLIRAIWTDDSALSTRISPRVAHYTGQVELAGVIQQGLAARKAGDVPTATVKLARAVELAGRSGNDGTSMLLAKVVQVDERTDIVRLREDVQAADEMALDARSTRTRRVRKQ